MAFMEQQKEIIVQLAFERFKQYGIKSVSIDDICRELGISKKTFYVYFKQKEDLIIETLNLMHEDHMAKGRKAMQGRSTLECLRQLVEIPTQIGDIHREPPFAYDLQKYYPAIYNEHIAFVRKQTRTFIRKHLQQGIQEGIYRKDLDVEMCSVFFVMMQQAYIQNVGKIRNISPKRMVSFALENFLRMVLSEEGQMQVSQMKKTTKKKQINKV